MRLQFDCPPGLLTILQAGWQNISAANAFVIIMRLLAARLDNGMCCGHRIMSLRPNAQCRTRLQWPILPQPQPQLPLCTPMARITQARMQKALHALFQHPNHHLRSQTRRWACSPSRLQHPSWTLGHLDLGQPTRLPASPTASHPHQCMPRSMPACAVAMVSAMVSDLGMQLMSGTACLHGRSCCGRSRSPTSQGVPASRKCGSACMSPMMQWTPSARRMISSAPSAW